VIGSLGPLDVKVVYDMGASGSFDRKESLYGYCKKAKRHDPSAELKVALETVCDAPYQLCVQPSVAEHFAGNLSKPIHKDDRHLWQGLKEQLNPT